MIFRQAVLQRAERIVNPQSFAPVRDKSCPVEDPQVPGCLRLGDPEHFDEVANAELPVIEQEPEHLEPGFIGQDLEKRGSLFHGLSLGKNIYITGFTVIVKEESTYCGHRLLPRMKYWYSSPGLPLGFAEQSSRAPPQGIIFLRTARQSIAKQIQRPIAMAISHSTALGTALPKTKCASFVYMLAATVVGRTILLFPGLVVSIPIQNQVFGIHIYQLLCPAQLHFDPDPVPADSYYNSGDLLQPPAAEEGAPR